VVRNGATSTIVGQTVLQPLTRHPYPRLTESRLGYELRLSEKNGYATLWSLYQSAGLVQHEFRGATLKRLASLASIARGNESDVQRIAYTDPEDRRAFRLLGHLVFRGDLELKQVRLCIQCVQSRGFVEACWDLRLMVGCPVHSRLALTHCPACQTELTWYRRGLLSCRCGAKLGGAVTADMLGPTTALLEIIRAKVMRSFSFPDGIAAFPSEDLEILSLRHLLRLIEVLGVCELGGDPTGSQMQVFSPTNIVVSAARVLSSWPYHFFQLLGRLGQRNLEGKYDVRRQYAPLYASLLRRKPGENPITFAFARRAFLDFVSNHVPTRAADPRLMRHLGENFSRRFLPCTEAARLKNVSPCRVARLAKAKNSAHGVDQPGRRIVVDNHTFVVPQLSPGRILRGREAATEIGIPSSVLRRLREEGHYEVLAMDPDLPGFHEGDVARFRAKLLGDAQAGRDGHDEHVLLPELMRGNRLSSGEKVSFLSAVLSGKIAITVPAGGATWQLTVSKDTVRDFISAERRRADHMNGRDACSMLGCDFDTLRALVNMKILNGAKTGNTWKIARASAELFKHTYIALSELAAARQTSSRKIERLSAARGIELLRAEIAPGRTRLFMLRTDMLNWSVHNTLCPIGGGGSPGREREPEPAPHARY
jgi:TniQ